MNSFTCYVACLYAVSSLCTVKGGYTKIHVDAAHCKYSIRIHNLRDKGEREIGVSVLFVALTMFGVCFI